MIRLQNSASFLRGWGVDEGGFQDQVENTINNNNNISLLKQRLWMNLSYPPVFHHDSLLPNNPSGNVHVTCNGGLGSSYVPHWGIASTSVTVLIGTVTTKQLRDSGELRSGNSWTDFHHSYVKLQFWFKLSKTITIFFGSVHLEPRVCGQSFWRGQ